MKALLGGSPSIAKRDHVEIVVVKARGVAIGAPEFIGEN
jgi:hypothetical protein